MQYCVWGWVCCISTSLFFLKCSDPMLLLLSDDPLETKERYAWLQWSIAGSLELQIVCYPKFLRYWWLEEGLVNCQWADSSWQWCASTFASLQGVLFLVLPHFNPPSVLVNSIFSLQRDFMYMPTMPRLWLVFFLSRFLLGVIPPELRKKDPLGEK